MTSTGQRIFDAESESLYDFVSKNGRGLYIPPYQRDYAWDKSNVDRLIDDTIQGINALLKRPDESITFLGTIIIMNDAKKTTISPLVKNQVYSQVLTVIDGQQRLTTLLMLSLAMFLEIETLWADLHKLKVDVPEDAKSWIQARVNDYRGYLSQLLAEQQNNGEAEYRHFPKMIRAFADTWSYESDKAIYASPIAWLLFEFVKYREGAPATWTKFPTSLKQSADGADNEAERRHFINLLKFMRARLRGLRGDDEFPDFLTIVRDDEKQETLFGEEFPADMKSNLEARLTEAAQSGEEQQEENKQIVKLRRWWDGAADLLTIISFAKFALERITLVTVTATTEDFAFDVFEALNTTGQPLTAIETFTPKVVQVVGLSNYKSSEEKKQIDIAFEYVRKATRAEERQKRSADLLVAFALAERGEKRSKNLADQRRFMRETFDQCKTAKEQQQFVRHLAELSRFFNSAWIADGGRPKVDGLELSDPAAVCLRFLVDFGHTITAPLLAQYAAAVAQKTDAEERKTALKVFGEVVLAVTAFTVLWRASRTTTDRIDEVYRSLMSKGPTGSMGLARGIRGNAPLPSVEDIRKALAERLTAEKSVGGQPGANIAGKQEWIEKTHVQPIHDTNETLARFVLMLAFHDVVEDGTGGLAPGKADSHPTLMLPLWNGDRYRTVEHIAPQSRKGGWSPDLYNEEEYERLGNLTLVPQSTNASLSNRPWNQKKRLFGALAAKTPEEAQKVLSDMKNDGVDISDIGATIYSGQYLPHVHAISNVQGPWDLAAVDKRGRQLADLIWRRVAPWLGLQA